MTIAQQLISAIHQRDTTKQAVMALNDAMKLHEPGDPCFECLENARNSVNQMLQVLITQVDEAQKAFDREYCQK